MLDDNSPWLIVNEIEMNLPYEFRVSLLNQKQRLGLIKNIFEVQTLLPN